MKAIFTGRKVFTAADWVFAFLLGAAVGLSLGLALEDVLPENQRIELEAEAP